MAGGAGQESAPFRIVSVPMTGTSAFSPRRISTRLRSQRRTGVSAQRTVDVVEDATHATAVGDVHFSVGEMQLFEDRPRLAEADLGVEHMDRAAA